VLGVALLVAVLVPWNLPVWRQLRRLRLAMEVDCDARVLRGGQSCMTVRPSWDSEADFARNWQHHQQRAGVVESSVRQQLVMQIFIGPNYAVLAWVMQSGAIARDATAPTFEIAPRQAQAMESRMLTTVEAQHRVIEHFDPCCVERRGLGR
jgi:hypothetical protein